MDDVFLTTEEVLEYLQVNLRTVYRLIKAGKIPAVRVGRQWRFRKADIDLWLEGQQTTVPLRAAGTTGAVAPACAHTAVAPMARTAPRLRRTTGPRPGAAARWRLAVKRATGKQRASGSLEFMVSEAGSGTTAPRAGRER